MQYFLGLEAFTYEQVMTPSLPVSIRKRIDPDVFESLTDDLIIKGLKLKNGIKPEEFDSDRKDDDNDDDSNPHPGNKGKLQLDATVCDADIKYPTDLDLLNESRQKAEELIDDLYLKSDIKDKPRTYRRVARKEFLNVLKMKRKPTKVLRKAIRKQINYLKRDVRIIHKMLDTIKDRPIVYFTLKVYRYFNPKVYQFKIISKSVLWFLGYPKNHKTGALIFTTVFIFHPSFVRFLSVCMILLFYVKIYIKKATVTVWKTEKQYLKMKKIGRPGKLSSN